MVNSSLFDAITIARRSLTVGTGLPLALTTTSPGSRPRRSARECSDTELIDIADPVAVSTGWICTPNRAAAGGGRAPPGSGSFRSASSFRSVSHSAKYASTSLCRLDVHCTPGILHPLEFGMHRLALFVGQIGLTHLAVEVVGQLRQIVPLRNDLNITGLRIDLNRSRRINQDNSPIDIEDHRLAIGYFLAGRRG